MDLFHNNIWSSDVHSNAASTQRSVGNASVAAHSFSGLEIAGAFICISVLAAVGADKLASDSQARANSAVHHSETSIDLQNSSSAADVTLPSAADNMSTEASSNVSTNVNTSTDEAGNTSARVTVNGQPVDVPANGSSQQTITTPGGGHTTVNISNSQSHVGSARNSASNQTSLHVSTSTHQETSMGR